MLQGTFWSYFIVWSFELWHTKTSVNTSRLLPKSGIWYHGRWITTTTATATAEAFPVRVTGAPCLLSLISHNVALCLYKLCWVRVKPVTSGFQCFNVIFRLLFSLCFFSTKSGYWEGKWHKSLQMKINQLMNKRSWSRNQGMLLYVKWNFILMKNKTLCFCFMFFCIF